jgi:hypothetical protein
VPREAPARCGGARRTRWSASTPLGALVHVRGYEVELHAAFSSFGADEAVRPPVRCCRRAGLSPEIGPGRYGREPAVSSSPEPADRRRLAHLGKAAEGLNPTAREATQLSRMPVTPSLSQAEWLGA